MKRLSISTFMDQSGPHEPTIGKPLDVRHEKLPPGFGNLVLGAPALAARTYSSLAPQTPPPTPPVKQIIPAPVDPFFALPQAQRRSPPIRNRIVAPVAKKVAANPFLDTVSGSKATSPTSSAGSNPFNDSAEINGEITVALSQADSRMLAKGNNPSASLPSNPRSRPPLPPLRKPSAAVRRQDPETLSAISEISVVGTPVRPQANTQRDFQQAYHELRSEVSGTSYSVSEYDIDWETVQQGLRDIQLDSQRV